MHMPQAEHFVKMGVIVAREDEFGDRTVALADQGGKWQWRAQIRSSTMTWLPAMITPGQRLWMRSALAADPIHE